MFFNFVCHFIKNSKHIGGYEIVSIFSRLCQKGVGAASPKPSDFLSLTLWKEQNIKTQVKSR